MFPPCRQHVATGFLFICLTQLRGVVRAGEKRRLSGKSAADQELKALPRPELVQTNELPFAKNRSLLEGEKATEREMKKALKEKERLHLIREGFTLKAKDSCFL